MQVDLMATHANTQLQTFVSPLPHPQAAGVDVFLVDWNKWSQIYLFPPVKCLTNLLPKIKQYKHHGVIIAPWIPSAPWFRTISERSKNFLHLHTDVFQEVRGQSMKKDSMIYDNWTAFNF